MSDESTFQAGAATSNITLSIASNRTVGNSRRQATNEHDELHARCLVLDDGQSRLALVVCELRHISAEVVAGAKQIIEQSTGIPPQCVLVSATHTHTSTGARLEDRDGQPYYEPVGPARTTKSEAWRIDHEAPSLATPVSYRERYGITRLSSIELAAKSLSKNRKLLKPVHDQVVCPWSSQHPRHDHPLIFPLDGELPACGDFICT